MKKWMKTALGAAAALALTPVVGYAAIDNTHHDVPYLSAGVITEKCAYCHSVSGIGGDPGVGKVGSFCIQVCHVSGSGITGTRGQVVPTSPGLFQYIGTAAGTYSMINTSAGVDIFQNGHGLSVTLMAGIGNSTGEPAAVAATGWPYTAGNALQCTSCHAVHDATNPPFLNAMLSDGVATGGGFCARCHNNAARKQDLAAGAGNHPIEFVWAPGTASGRQGSTKTDGTIMNNRRLVNNAPAVINVMATGVANGAAAGALNALAANWNLGGHVVAPTTGLPTSGTGGADQFGCYSCHPVHAQASATGNGGDKLLVGAQMSTVCFGCHSIDPGTTNYGHPIYPEIPVVTGITTSWGAVPLTAAYSAISATYYRPDGAAGPFTSAPYCVSCHQVHGARSGRMAIRLDNGDGTQMPALNADGAVCELCHATSYTNPTTANKHHPGQALTYTDAANGSFIGTTAWMTSDGLGDLDDGLSCPDCHIGDGRLPAGTAKRAAAHNWQ